MTDFVRVASASQIADPGRELVELDDRVLVLLKVDGRFYCLDDVCTHDGGPLSDGPLDGLELACPRHGAKFDVATGAALTMPATRATQAHEVKVEGDDVYVRICQPGWVPPADVYIPPPETSAPPPAFKPLGASVLSAPPASAAPSSPAVAAAATASTESSPPRDLCEEVVLEELKKVIDPELFVNIVDLGLIYVVNIHEPVDDRRKISIDMTMTSPMCPAGPQLIGNSKQVLGALPSVSEVEVRIVLDPPWTPDRMTEAARDQLGIF
jgi:metal-sulfur cluster biosynthetic enzyme/nitrite reductase/ring-hydroxylating ferredoxin subunit